MTPKPLGTRIREVFRPPTQPEITLAPPIERTVPSVMDGAEFTAPYQPFTQKAKTNGVSPAQLRSIAVNYPIARSCIDYRSTQITQLEWVITDEDANRAPDKVYEFFRHPQGKAYRLRNFIDKTLFDLLTLDAVAIYRKRNRRGELIGLLPVDAATIHVITTEAGELPEPPAIAYRQVIRGEVVASMTTDELIYDCLNPRTYSPYGVAPLESLVLQATASLRVDMYNMAFVTEGNVPEGFIFLPDNIANTPDKLTQFQRWFDLFTAGDATMMRRLRVMPEAKYEPTKKPGDMDFHLFQMWLMQCTCATFGVPPQAIGFTNDMNRANSESQLSLGKDRGLRPLANFFRDMFDDVVAELSSAEYRFKWTSLDPVDRAREAEIAAKMIPLGALTLDEWRIKVGLEPMGVAYVPPVVAASGMQAARADIVRWKRAAINDFKAGRKFRVFKSDSISSTVADEIMAELSEVDTKEDIYEVFFGRLSVV